MYRVSKVFLISIKYYHNYYLVSTRNQPAPFVHPYDVKIIGGKRIIIWKDKEKENDKQKNSKNEEKVKEEKNDKK